MTRLRRCAATGGEGGGAARRRQWRHGEGHGAQRHGLATARRESIGPKESQQRLSLPDAIVQTRPPRQVELRSIGADASEDPEVAAFEADVLACANGIVKGLVDDALDDLILISGEGFLDPSPWDHREASDITSEDSMWFVSDAETVRASCDPVIYEESWEDVLDQLDDEGEPEAEMTPGLLSPVGSQRSGQVTSCLPDLHAEGGEYYEDDSEFGFVEVLSTADDDTGLAAKQANEYVLSAMEQARYVAESSDEDALPEPLAEPATMDEQQEVVLPATSGEARSGSELAFDLVCSALDFGLAHVSDGVRGGEGQSPMPRASDPTPFPRRLCPSSGNGVGCQPFPLDCLPSAVLQLPPPKVEAPSLANLWKVDESTEDLTSKVQQQSPQEEADETNVGRQPAAKSSPSAEAAEKRPKSTCSKVAMVQLLRNERRVLEDQQSDDWTKPAPQREAKQGTARLTRQSKTTFTRLAPLQVPQRLDLPSRSTSRVAAPESPLARPGSSWHSDFSACRDFHVRSPSKATPASGAPPVSAMALDLGKAIKASPVLPMSAMALDLGKDVDWIARPASSQLGNGVTRSSSTGALRFSKPKAPKVLPPLKESNSLAQNWSLGNLRSWEGRDAMSSQERLRSWVVA